MRDLRPPARRGDRRRPELNGGSFDLLDVPTAATAKVVVVLCHATAAIEGFTGVTAQHVHLMASSHLAELVVDGGQRNR
jgi:hypothetical protein